MGSSQRNPLNSALELLVLFRFLKRCHTFLIFLMFLIVIVGVRCPDAFGPGPRLVSYRKYLTESILAPFVPEGTRLLPGGVLALGGAFFFNS